jgi:GNAT superfamily N-acetyltransferase
MIVYREATLQDTENIALLHARSWQQHYRGILRDEFLDNEVIENRLNLWQSRLQHPQENQYVIVAEEEDKLYGFTCVLAHADPIWGALLDNLHVLSQQKGQGIGTHLMKSAAQWVHARDKNSGLYLWVYKDNVNARKFYESIGGINYEQKTEENPGGGYAQICRYVWKDLKEWMDRP